MFLLILVLMKVVKKKKKPFDGIKFNHHFSPYLVVFVSSSSIIFVCRFLVTVDFGPSLTYVSMQDKSLHTSFIQG